jgi:hypothetical protein
MEFVSWQTQYRVENRVSSEVDKGILCSDGYNNDDGHDWDLINDVDGIVGKEFDRWLQVHELFARQRILNSSCWVFIWISFI